MNSGVRLVNIYGKWSIIFLLCEINFYNDYNSHEDNIHKVNNSHEDNINKVYMRAERYYEHNKK